MSPYEVTRSAVLPAPAEDVFPLVNSFHEWTRWSPWESVDPTMERSYSGSDAGVGAKYAWNGNRKAGAGSMEIVESTEPSGIRILITFTKPFKARNPTSFTFTPVGSTTRVTWTMTGENKGIARIFGVFMNMDRMIGSDFERGLASLAGAVAGGRPEHT
ncbi:SRPBCC family protein [Arthrobacter sp. Br18]|uniref:SRPBCC family protein n=1 Tax=Arthrobacter sp. Br18 TaxID=1312954 RepID=UPI000479A54C|nr:SRPBCC family protein [Arthrobacter sp. Br18]